MNTPVSFGTSTTVIQKTSCLEILHVEKNQRSKLWGVRALVEEDKEVVTNQLFV